MKLCRLDRGNGEAALRLQCNSEQLTSTHSFTCIVKFLNRLHLVQDAMQQRLQQDLQHEKQKGEADQKAAVSQYSLELQQTRQQLTDAKREANTLKLEVDSLKG